VESPSVPRVSARVSASTMSAASVPGARGGDRAWPPPPPSEGSARSAHRLRADAAPERRRVRRPARCTAPLSQEGARDMTETKTKTIVVGMDLEEEGDLAL